MDKENQYSIPDHLKDASEELKERLILREELRNSYEKHQLRYLTISNLEGVELVVDCTSGVAVLTRQITSHIGTHSKQKKYLDDSVAEAKRRKSYLQSNYIIKISTLSRKINIMTAQEGLYNTLDAYKDKIIELLAKHFTIDEVYSTITKEWNHRINIMQLKKWVKLHQTEIETAKEQYLLSNKEFRIAHETGRLDILNRQLIKAEEDNKPDLILKIVEQARKEVKGDQLKLTVDGKIDINATLQGQKIVQDVSTRLPINMLIIGLVAAKQGINPLSIMSSLATSYYANHNGFNGAIDPNAEIQSPTNLIQNYNWDELEQKNKAFIQETNKPITDITEYQDPEEQQKAEDIKEKLLNSLKKLQVKDEM
jgi:hypothetical protein